MEALKMINKLPQYTTMLFSNIWESAADFKTDFAASPFNGCISSVEGTPTEANPIVPHDNVSRTFYLLFAKYGNNPIANLDITQFKMKIFSLMFMFGPTWEKRLELQERLRALGESDLLAGSKAIYNTAVNPSTAPVTTTLEELAYINGQNTTNHKRSKMEAYGQLWELLDNDVTNDYLTKFKVCFKQFVAPERPLLYITNEDEEEVEEDEGE